MEGWLVLGLLLFRPEDNLVDHLKNIQNEYEEFHQPKEKKVNPVPNSIAKSPPTIMISNRFHEKWKHLQGKFYDKSGTHVSRVRFFH